MSRSLAGLVGERYRLEQLLGQGAMGSVYQAYDRLTGQRVALKLVPVDGDAENPPDDDPALPDKTQTRALCFSDKTAELQTAQSMRAFRNYPGGGSSNKSATSLIWARMALTQEFRTLASLRHPNIISVLDYGFIARSQPFFTMELLQCAQNLRAASQGLPLAQKAMLLVQLLRALAYLHRRGILHRDLKPANVMVLASREGLQVKLLDFGLSLARSHVQEKPEEIAGTLSYMAPELFQENAISEAADLFAVGVIAYELFAGRHPFHRGDNDQLIEAILGSDPDWEPFQSHEALATLMRRLLAKSPAARPSADEALTALFEAVGIPVAKETAVSRESTLQAARFVGREEAFAVLRAAIEDARGGLGEVRLLAGESGVGKSRMMEELRIYSLVQGVLSMRGQAVSEGGGAYGVWREIFSMLCLCTELSELDASVVKSVLPDLEVLLERTVPDAPVLNPQAAQLRLTHVLESLLLRQNQPLLVLLEDLHWADAESLALLRRLVPSCRARPIVIVASFRDDERPDLPQALPGCPVLKLSRLSAPNITELCQSMLGAQGSTPELVSFLAEETEGNVFFVIEVLRALAEEAGQLSLVASHRPSKSVLTGGIQAIVQRRLARLPAEARPFLRLAAVGGRQLDLAVLRCFEVRIEPWLYLAADAAVLEVSDQCWRFAHDKIRESLLLELDSTERRRLHLELARALQATYPDSAAHAAALAEHYQRGGKPDQAAFYLVEAGVHSLRQGATDQAATRLQQALAPQSRALLLKVQAARAYSGLIQATMALGRIVPCIATYEQFVAEVGLPVPAGFLSMVRAGGVMLAQQLDAAPAMTLETDEDRRVLSEVAQASRWAGEAYAWDGQPRKSIVAVLRGMELAKALGDKALQGYFLAMFSYLASLIPLRQISRRLLESGSRRIEGLPDFRAEMDVRRVASVRHVNEADWESAKLQLTALIALARRLGDQQALLFGLSFRCFVAFRQADESAFETYGSELYEVSRRNQSDTFSRLYPLHQGINALRRGDVDSAQRLLAEAEGYVKKSEDLLGRVMTGGLIAHYLLLQGNKEKALLRAQETLAHIESVRFTVETFGEAVSAVTEVYLSLWEAGSAAERRQLQGPLYRALAAMRRCGRIFPAFFPRALLWHGRAAWNHGALRLARRLAQASQERAKRLEMPFDEALAQKWLARFAETPQGVPTGLFREARGLLHLARRLL